LRSGTRSVTPDPPSGFAAITDLTKPTRPSRRYTP